MSAQSFLAIFGLAFEVTDPKEIEDLEVRRDARIVAARRARLSFYWGNFGLDGVDRFRLFIGARLGVFGEENLAELSVTDEDLAATIANTQARLAEAGLHGEPALHLAWQPDV